jgi:hypothetical protein
MADIRVLTYEYNAGAEQVPVFLDEFTGEYRGIQLEPVVAGVGYIQSTLSTRAAVEGNTASWVTWPSGSISAVTQDTINPVATAIRVYRTSGSLRLNVRIV